MAEGGEISFGSGSEYIYDFYCELCIDDKKQVEAYGYCNDCEEYLCEICYNGHTRSRSTRYHVLQDKNSMPRDTPLSADRVSKNISTKCKSHSAKLVEFYCRSHDVLGCSTCFATAHKSCTKVESILEESENILDSQHYKSFIMKLETMKSKSEKMIKLSLDNKTSIQKCCSDAVSSVRQVKEEIIVILNEIENSTVALAEKICLECEEQMNNLTKECSDLSVRIEEMNSEFERLQSSKHVCQLYINMREIESEVNALQESLRNSERKNVVKMFTFEPNAELKNYLKFQDVLGKIALQKQEEIEPDCLATAKDTNNMAAAKVADIDVRSRSDTQDCWITGSDLLPSNRLAIVDRNNDKVKVFDSQSNSLLTELKLSSKPWDITIINKIQAAVTLSGSKKMLIIKVANTLTEEREITFSDECRGVAYSQDRMLVTFVTSPHVKIIDMHGNVIRSIENDSDGNKLFVWPQYVSVSKDGETIYVSDYDRGTVTSLTFDGVVKSVYKDEELRGPEKVCTDHRGNVYVCGYERINVHMITADCKKVKVILTEANGLDSGVLSVSHCQDTNRLFIGMYNRNKLNVHQLS